MNITDQMRKFLNIMNEAPSNKVDDPNVTYSSDEKKGKVTANLRGTTSAKYTKLAQNLARMKALQQEITELEESVKAEARETIADLFFAEEEIFTRVVETVSFTITLSKKPEETNTVKYAKVLEELQNSLTPDLIDKLNDLKNKFTTTTQKAASLSYATKESINEGFVDKLKDIFKRYLNAIMSWGNNYDKRLDSLKQEVDLV